MRSFSSLFIFSSLVLALTGRTVAQSFQPPAYQWVTGAYGTAPATAYANGTALSPDGSVYSAYEHRAGRLTVPPQSFASGGMSVIKYDAAGNFSRRLTWCAAGRIASLTTDTHGAAYVMGTFSDTLYLPGTTPIPGPRQSGSTVVSDFFVAKWNAAGNLMWVQHGITSGHTEDWPYNNQLGVDWAGRVTIASQVRAYFGATTTLRFGTHTLSSLGLFVAQFDSTGNVNWLKGNDVNTGAYATGIAVEPASGIMVVAGTLNSNNSLSWAGHSVAPTGSAWFWMRLDAGGNYLNSFASALSCNLPGPLVGAGDNGYSFVALPLSNSSISIYTINGAPVALPAARGNNYTIVARLDPNGVPQWTRVLAQANVDVRTMALTTAPTGILWRGGFGGPSLCYLTGYYSTNSTTPFTIDGLSLPPVTGSALNAGMVLALEELSGLAQWGLTCGGGADNELRDISAQPNGEVAITGFGSGSNFTFGSLPLTFPAAANSNPKSFTAKILQSYNTMTGRVYLDVNANNAFDAGIDAPRAGSVVTVQPGNQWAVTATGGAYTGLVGGPGTYTVGPPTAPRYHTVTATGATSATFSGYGGVAANLDFAFRPIPNQPDLQLSLTPMNHARAGFAVRYHVQYRNVGTTTFPGDTIKVALDSLFTYLSNTGGGTLAGRVLRVPYGSLAPDQEGSFDVLCQLPTSAHVNTILITSATIGPLSGDLTPDDNTETSRLPITGPVDPNNISVNWPVLTPQQVTAGEWLEYVIRFQNLGNDTAFSVLLRDSLPDTQLNLSTLSLIAASHTCTWTIRPGGLLVVQFTNIRLPHAGVNTIGSLGFVRFRVKPRPTLAIGNLITNRADIHFDFNAPVPTNTATTEVGAPAGLPGTPADGLPGAAWPNPTHGTLHVEATLPTAGRLTLHLLDATGRQVLEQTTSTPAGTTRQMLDVRELPAGLYLLRAEANGRGFTRRLVVN